MKRLQILVVSLMFVFIGQAVVNAQPIVVVVPSAFTSAEAPNGNSSPLDGGGIGNHDQFVYDSSEFPEAGQITEIRFRLDPFTTSSFGPETINGIVIQLSTTSKAVDGLDSANFANNVGADVVEVFNGNLTISGTSCASGPCPFDTIIAFQTPFPYDPTQGNLLVDIANPDPIGSFTSPIFWDATNSDMTDSVSRVHSNNGAGATFGGMDSVGLVTQFNIETVNEDPEVIIDDAIDEVEDLVDSSPTLVGGQGNALAGKLEKALELIDQGKIKQAINKLNAFINQVNSLIDNGDLTQAEGQSLIDAANSAIDQLSE